MDEEAQIRDARHDDAPALTALAVALALGTRPRVDGVAGALAAMIEGQDVAVLVADRGQGPVGYVAVHRLHALFAGGSVALVEELVVGTASRGEGIGSRLVTAAEDVARWWGVSYLAVATGRATAFYEGRGYTPTATFLRKQLF